MKKKIYRKPSIKVCVIELENMIATSVIGDADIPKGEGTIPSEADAKLNELFELLEE